MTFDLAKAREDTLGCKNVLHFNNAGAALMPKCVKESIISYIGLEEHMGGYEAADQSYDALERAYDAAAELIGCSRGEIAIMENASRAWDMAFYSIPLLSGDRILTSTSEYGSNFISFLHLAQKIGVSIEIIPNDEYGQISTAGLCRLLDQRVKLIAITHIPSNNGLINPISAIGEIAKSAGVLYLVDACQSVGQVPVSVDLIGCDLLSTAGRKYLRGPRGTGFLYVRRSLIERLDPPLIDFQAAHWVKSDYYELRTDARRFETWETSYANRIGLGVAIDYALSWKLDTTWVRIQTLASELRERLLEIPQVVLRDTGREQCGIVTFTIEEKDPEDVRILLMKQNINVSVSETRVMRVDMEARKIKNLVRASLHYYNNEEEVQQFCRAIESISHRRKIYSNYSGKLESRKKG